jgi:hypothetical protein
MTAPCALEILQKFGLFERFQERARLDERKIEEYRQRSSAFDWVNMATIPLTIARLLEVLRQTSCLVPPRTGHLGNWSDIITGHIGPRNDNTVICSEQKLGYPLLLDFNQTEDLTLQKGDLTYLPGSIVERGKREELPLFTWNGTQFVERTREDPLFVPFVLTPVEGQLLPLTQIQRRRYSKHENIPFRFFSSIVCQKQQLIKEILTVLIAEAHTQQELVQIVDRAVTLDGHMLRSAIHVEGTGYRVAQSWYKDACSLVDAILLPYQAAANPESFFHAISALPEALPLLASSFGLLLFAILHTHYPGCAIERSTMTRPCNPHVHWGALDMAGYPPKKRGYYPKKVPYARSVHKKLVTHFPEIDPIFFILLPSSIFLLWPSDAYPEDLALIEQLIHAVHQTTDSLLGAHEALAHEIDRQVRLWLPQAHLSAHFLLRFTGKPKILVLDAMPVQSKALEPEGFASLTLQQASLLVGSLYESFS